MYQERGVWIVCMQNEEANLPIIPLWEPPIKPLPGATCGACGNYI